MGIKDWSELVVSTEMNQRKSDTNLLVGDSRQAHVELGWRHPVEFDSMTKAMAVYDQSLLADPTAVWDPGN